MHVLMIICLKCDTLKYYLYYTRAENSLRTPLEVGNFFHQFPQALDPTHKTFLSCSHNKLMANWVGFFGETRVVTECTWKVTHLLSSYQPSNSEHRVVQKYA